MTMFTQVFVCAPSGERSAQSHAITLGRYMSAAPTDVPGAVEAFAVDGTPADSVRSCRGGAVGPHGARLTGGIRAFGSMTWVFCPPALPGNGQEQEEGGSVGKSVSKCCCSQLLAAGHAGPAQPAVCIWHPVRHRRPCGRGPGGGCGWAQGRPGREGKVEVV